MKNSFTHEFPILNNCTYLNTANSGLLSRALMEWRREQDLAFFEKGSSFRNDQADQLLQVKRSIAQFFNADLSYTFLVPNFSNGFNIFLSGLADTERFLLLENDYPSINYAVESKGFRCHYSPADENMEEQLINSIRTYQPTVLAFSLVQYHNGLKIDLRFLQQLKSLFPELLIVADGTQFCGTELFDFTQSGIDVLISSGYKWMLAGYGNGFLLIRGQSAQRIFNSARTISLPKETFLSHKGLLNLAFEPGHQDTVNFGGLQKGIEYIQELGPGEIAGRIKDLASRAKTAFTDRGLLDRSVALRKGHAPIFNLNVAAETIERLKSSGILFSSRGKGIRVSFHFYNSESDLNTLLEVIDNSHL